MVAQLVVAQNVMSAENHKILGRFFILALARISCAPGEDEYEFFVV